MFRGSRGGSGGGGGGSGDGRDFAVQLISVANTPYSPTLSSTKSDLISIDTSGGQVTVNLPSPTSIAGKVVIIKDATGQASSNSVTVSTTGNIDNQGSVSISNSFASLFLISDGVRWTIN